VHWQDTYVGRPHLSFIYIKGGEILFIHSHTNIIIRDVRAKANLLFIFVALGMYSHVALVSGTWESSLVSR